MEKSMRKQTRTARSTGKIKAGVQCPSCKDIIFSFYDSDFRRCMCGKVFIDGGDEHRRVGAEPPIDPKDIISAYRPEREAERLMSKAVRSKLPPVPPPLSYFSGKERHQLIWRWDEWHWPHSLGAYPDGGCYHGAIYSHRFVIGPLEIRLWAEPN